jgi:hypothetical protein
MTSEANVETRRRDGFGTRVVQQDARYGRLERLVLTAALATPEAEEAIKARLAALPVTLTAKLVPVHELTRSGDALTMTSEVPAGVALSDVLRALELGTLRLPVATLLETAGTVVRGAAALHVRGSFAHGALSPLHIVLRPDGTVLFAGAALADALERLQLTRDQVWREFGLALPSAPGAPRFDRRADVTQLGAVVLAILLRRPLQVDEYPAALDTLIVEATTPFDGERLKAVQAWLREALHLGGRSAFATTADAATAFAAIARDSKTADSYATA